MKKLILSQDEFNRLDEYQLPEDVINNEADLFILKDFASLLKIYKERKGIFFQNKIYTLELLLKNKNLIGIDTLVMPDRLAYIKNHLVGFTMPFFKNNINAGTILRSTAYDVDFKIKLLREIGNIIMKVISEYDETGFLLGDVHEHNFILNKDDEKIYAVDLDGCKIKDNIINVIKYFPRDETYKYELDGIYPKASVNSELLCYAYIVLNTIAGVDISKRGLTNFYGYLQYLLDNGFEKELIDVFIRLYEDKDNYFPLELLDTIPDNLELTSYKMYKYKKRNN